MGVCGTAIDKLPQTTNRSGATDSTTTAGHSSATLDRRADVGTLWMGVGGGNGAVSNLCLYSFLPACVPTTSRYYQQCCSRLSQ